MKSYKAGVGGEKNLLNLRVKKQVQNNHPPELTTVRFSGFPLYDMKLIISSSLDFVQAHCKKVTTLDFKSTLYTLPQPASLPVGLLKGF